jgi:hypothetical protein
MSSEIKNDKINQINITNILTQENEIGDVKRINKTKAPCSNCGIRTHSYKHCYVPITSWGIILVSCGNMKKPTHEETVDIKAVNIYDIEKRVKVNDIHDRNIVSEIYETLQFLLISRKHSVGYAEFIRGKYKPNKIDEIIYLFRQMMQKEIDGIKNCITDGTGFDALWKEFWSDKADARHLESDKKTSKYNFNILMKTSIEGTQLDLLKIVTTIKAENMLPEWGFPKGRKNKDESDLDCAIREFKEESGYLDEDYKIIKEINPIYEDFIGTNGKRYRHVYYVAEFMSKKEPQNNITQSQMYEIGNIKFMKYQLAIESIRSYHVERKNILDKLMSYYQDKLLLANK